MSALTVAGTSIAFAPSRAVAETPPPAPSAAPSAPHVAAISAAARAQALAMRRFDAQLSDEQLDEIARGIDEGYAAAPLLSPRSAPLRNGDEPAVRFAASRARS